MNLHHIEFLLIDMRTLKGAEWLEIAEWDWHWGEYVVCSLICLLSRETVPGRINTATTNCAVPIALSHQNNKGDKLIVSQAFFSKKTNIFLLTFRSS